MNGNHSKPYAILVFGAPMSGKTAFASKFSHQFKAPLLNYDALPGISRKTFLSLVDQIAQCGQNFLIEGASDTFKHREEIRSILRSTGYNPVLLWIQTDTNTIKYRIKSHLKSVEKAKAFFEERLTQLEAPEDSESPVVISGKHTFETQLKSALSSLSKI